jgi:hypothetical protein
MAAGPLLKHAVEDLTALPEDAPERIAAEQILLSLEHVLQKKPRRTRQEQEFIVTMRGTWADARKQGRAEGRADDVLTVLRVRGIPVSEAERKRILAEKDPARLERMLEKAVVAASVADVLANPS